jgi:predicted  nucleic acid-binding Zn-ribbon protein
LNDKIAQLNSAIDNFSTEADRGLSDKISKLNGEVEKLEKNAEGGAEAAA